MEPVFNVVLPVFGIMLAGYACGRAGLLGAASGGALNGFVYYVALPALFFIAMSRAPIGDVFYWPFLAAFGGGILATYAIAYLVGAFVFPNGLGALSLHGMSAVFSNTGYMGIPLLLIAFGEDGSLPGVITTIITGAVIMSFVTAMLEIDLSEGLGPLRILRNATVGVVKSPLVLSATAGLLASYWQAPIPQPLATFCEITGAAAGPAALFAMGLFMVGKSITASLGEVSWLCVLKLIVQPLITWWLAYELLQLSELWAASAVIAAALPTGALVFVLAERYQVYVARSTAVITLSTLASVVTLSLLFTLLGIG